MNFIAFLLPFLGIGIPAHAEALPQVMVMPVVENAEKDPITGLNPSLIPICACESTGSKEGKPRQFDNSGGVLRGTINPQDVGMCQINLDYHQKSAEKLGYDLFSEKGNIAYANLLYKTQGTVPWSLSKRCWK